MANGYSTLIPEDVRKEIEEIKRVGAELKKSPQEARSFLNGAGILTSAGKLAPRYR
jgi:hypothetical protein